MSTARALKLVGVVVLLAMPVMAGSNSHSEAVTATCIRVLDGDTLVVKCHGREVTVELEGVDAPELGQPLGRQVRGFVRALVQGREITIDMVDRGDDGGQARVSVAGQDLSELLAERGLAWATDGGALAESAARARLARCGIWLDPAPVPPWEFRETTT